MLAAELASEAARMLPPPGGAALGGDNQVLVTLGGTLSYSVLYDTDAEAWVAQHDGRGAAALALMRSLGGPRGVLMEADRLAITVAAPWPTGGADQTAAWPLASIEAPYPRGGEYPARPQRDITEVSVLIRVAGEVAATLLAEKLRRLQARWEGGHEQQTEPQEPPQAEGHAQDAEWQLVANCLGRSLPVTVMDVQVHAASGGAAGGSAPAAGAVVSVRLHIRGIAQALLSTCCSLTVVSIELWCGIHEVAQAPAVLVLERSGSSITGDGEAMALVTELNSLTVPWVGPAGATGTAVATGVEGLEREPQDDVRMLVTDLGTLELYAVSQQLAGGCRGGVTASVPVPDSQLLPGSLDVSAGLRLLLSSSDGEQRRAIVLAGANLLSYAVLRGLPCIAATVRRALTTLGCSLEEADRLSAAAAGFSEDEAIGTSWPEPEPDCSPFVHAADVARDSAAHSVQDQGQESNYGAQGGGEGLPLVALAVLSGNIETVKQLLRWAGEEGLGAEWAMRRHKGRSPLQVAALAVWGEGADAGVAGADAKTLGPWAAYLAQVELLLQQLPRGTRLAGKGSSAGSAVLPCVAEKGTGASAAAGLGSTGVTPSSPRPPAAWGGRHPLLICLLGYPDPAHEAAFRRFTEPLEAQVAGCWVLLMCALLAVALLRQLRGGGGGDPAEAPVSLLFAWPYVVLAAGLALHP
ncbi:hypothetical protein GPECTOR_2g1090 [Gonium pectorale]|uniref:Uncharacterized protein n=1 Tax=Gonium pectorale TaxID=33097 RepID=A0A150H0C9_GONPE|nr:hypothetical protein GPECTOR_2g1090 [Gonium pectorale]|eukprot:KXZ55541.1 hypothetical protein GPECTOR_2g1090 [Gonium pectorale]